MSRVRTGLTALWWRLALVSYVALVGVEIADSASQQAPWPVWLVKTGPLLVFLPGLLKDNLRSYIWLCFVCLMYFLALVLRLFAMPGELWGIVGTICVVSLFCSAMLYVRHRARDSHPQPVEVQD